MGCKQTTFQSETFQSSQCGGSGREGAVAAAAPLLNHQYSTAHARELHCRALVTTRELPAPRRATRQNDNLGFPDWLSITFQCSITPHTSCCKSASFKNTR